MRRAPLPTSGCSRQFDEFFLKFRKRKLHFVILFAVVVPDFKFKGASIMIFGTNSHHFTVSLFLNLEDILFSLRRQVQ